MTAEAGKNQGGRPTDFTPELGEEICERIADGESLRAICRDDDMPDTRTVRRWLRKGDEEDEGPFQRFRRQYARAREDQGDTDADDVKDIAKRCEDGDITAEQARVLIDAHKWSAAKRKPKAYGDKHVHVGGGPDDAPIRHEFGSLSDAELEARIAAKLRGGDEPASGA